MELGGTESQEVDAETYVFIDRGDLMDAEWDFHAFVREKLWRWADLSEEYAGTFGLHHSSRRMLTVEVDVDREAQKDEHDPTGGRGISGNMNSKLAAAESKEVLRSAV